MQAGYRRKDRTEQAGSRAWERRRRFAWFAMMASWQRHIMVHQFAFGPDPRTMR
jgi:hypothetical protein